MRKLIAAIAACVGLAGCGVDSPGGRNALMNQQMFTVVPHPSDPNRLIVRVVLPEIGSTLTPEQLRNLATGAFADQCGSVSVEDMQVTVAGMQSLGIERRLYSVTIRCPNGATRPFVAAAR